MKMRSEDPWLLGCKQVAYLTQGAVCQLIFNTRIFPAAQAVHQAVVHLLQCAHAADPLPAPAHRPCTALTSLLPPLHSLNEQCMQSKADCGCALALHLMRLAEAKELPPATDLHAPSAADNCSPEGTSPTR